MEDSFQTVSTSSRNVKTTIISFIVMGVLACLGLMISFKTFIFLEAMLLIICIMTLLIVSKVKWDIENSVRAANKNSNDKLLHIIFSEYDGRNLAPKYFITISLYELLNRFNSHNYTKDEIEKLSYSIAS